MATDFDPTNQTELDLNAKCFERKNFTVNNTLGPKFTILNLPERYIPIHRCMHIRINYLERIPMIGPHRPLWARYGEYQYLPPQRWLHNIEHGAIVGLYHPCADSKEVTILK